MRQREPDDTAYHLVRRVLRSKAGLRELLRGAVCDEERKQDGPEYAGLRSPSHRIPPVVLPNGPRLSCGRNARGRKAVERQTKRLTSEATQFFPPGARQLQALVRPLPPGLEKVDANLLLHAATALHLDSTDRFIGVGDSSTGVLV